jgi:hypothetical protein
VKTKTTKRINSYMGRSDNFRPNYSNIRLTLRKLNNTFGQGCTKKRVFFWAKTAKKYHYKYVQFFFTKSDHYGSLIGENLYKKYYPIKYEYFLACFHPKKTLFFWGNVIKVFILTDSGSHISLSVTTKTFILLSVKTMAAIRSNQSERGQPD